MLLRSGGAHVLPGRAVAMRGRVVPGGHLTGARLEGVLALVHHGTMVAQTQLLLQLLLVLLLLVIMLLLLVVLLVVVVGREVLSVWRLWLVVLLLL